MISCSGKEMAPYPVIRQHLNGCGSLLTAHWHGQDTPGMKATALGWIDEVWYGARNAANIAMLPLRETVEQLLRIGMRGMGKQ
jgi:hypothetical protein